MIINIICIYIDIFYIYYIYYYFILLLFYTYICVYNQNNLFFISIVCLASGDYVVPAGATVIIGTIKLHRLESVYPNPDTFNPDNFLPEKTANRHYYAFVPFSAGPRSCVGRKYAMLKLKILLSTILRNFRVKSEVKEDDFRLQADIILKRAEGFPIKLIPRKSVAVQA